MVAKLFTIDCISAEFKAVPIITAERHAREANILSNLGNLIIESESVLFFDPSSFFPIKKFLIETFDLRVSKLSPACS
jgi:hypothetical protein